MELLWYHEQERCDSVLLAKLKGKNLKQVKDCQVYPTRSKTNPLIELVKATGNVQQEL